MLVNQHADLYREARCHEALFIRMEVRDLGLLVVVAAR
jgi:hypothetical protein